MKIFETNNAPKPVEGPQADIELPISVTVRGADQLKNVSTKKVPIKELRGTGQKVFSDAKNQKVKVQGDPL